MKFKKRGNARSVAEFVSQNTGLTPDVFLNPELFSFLPKLRETGMCIKNWVRSHPGKMIYLVGDYDADGICAATILYLTFLYMHLPCHVIIPRRKADGYGLNESIIDQIPEGLLITVDNGIAAKEAILKAKKKGLSVVVTDHHLPPKDGLPKADIILNPWCETDNIFQSWCGAGLAWRLSVELTNYVYYDLMALAAIATVADMMPLIGPNRALVKQGIDILRNGGGGAGIQLLIERNKFLDRSLLNEEDIAFFLAPVINASERLYDGGAMKVHQLLSYVPDGNEQTAMMKGYLADQLIENNNERKQKTAAALEQVPDLKSGKAAVVFVNGCEEGIIGLVAAKITEEYQIPVVVFTTSHNDPEILKGSGRSVEGIHLYDKLSEMKDLIVKFGGHEGAAGLSIKRENLDAFRKRFETVCGDIPIPDKNVVSYDIQVHPGNLKQVLEELRAFAPFGQGNPKPVLYLRYEGNDREKITYLKKDGKDAHLKVKGSLELIGWGLSDAYKEMGSPLSFGATGMLEEKHFRGRSYLQFRMDQVGE